jgi:hypothetical protein
MTATICAQEELPDSPQPAKTIISIRINTEVLNRYKASASRCGIGYQSLINEVLRLHLEEADAREANPAKCVGLDEVALRRIFREELLFASLRKSQPA